MTTGDFYLILLQPVDKQQADFHNALCLIITVVKLKKGFHNISFLLRLSPSICKMYVYLNGYYLCFFFAM